MRDLPDAAHLQFGVFTAAQAMPDGWTRGALRHAITSGRLLQPRPKTFAVPADPRDPDRYVVDAARRAVAAVLTHQGALVSHASAARLWRLPVIEQSPRGCLTVPPGLRRHAAGVHLHQGVVPLSHRRTIGRVLVTSAARTVVDCARELGIEASVVMADAALRKGRATPSELADVVGSCHGLPFSRRATRLTDFLDPRSESALESRSRWRMHLANLPPPLTQVVILDQWGRFIARVDFYWPEFGVVGEADGEAKQQSLIALRAQHDRERELRDLGLPVVRWGWRDLDPFDGVVGRLENAFAHGIPPGSDRRWIVAPRMPR